MHNKYKFFLWIDLTVADPQGANPQGWGASLLFDQIFPINCMKMKELDPGASLAPFFHPPMNY